MSENNVKYELQNILQGKIQVSQGELIQTIATYLRESTQTGGTTQRNEPNKNEETKKLEEYINENNLWNYNINFDLFISEGTEHHRQGKQRKNQVTIYLFTLNNYKFRFYNSLLYVCFDLNSNYLCSEKYLHQTLFL